MKILFTCALVALLALSPLAASAQSVAHREVPRGDVTGLEMTIEGALAAPPGGELAWFVTVHEVVHRRDLRPAPGAHLRVTASYSEGPAILETTADADGRARLAVRLPDDLDASPHLVVEAVSERGIRRTFDADVELVPSQSVELFVDRTAAPPRGRVLAFGRVRDEVLGRFASDQEVVVAVRSPVGAALSGARTVRTDTRGVFSAELTLPDEITDANVVATSADGEARQQLRIEEPTVPTLWIRATPRDVVVAPGGSTPVDVEVRDASGVPVEGARVDWADAPVPEDETPIRTDARGHAEVLWTLGRLAGAGGDWSETTRALDAVHPAHGTGSGLAALRVAGPGPFVVWAVEGGALAAGLPGRVYVRVARADGTAEAAQDVRLTIADRAPSTARTDAEGVAVLDLGRPGRATASAEDEADESCVGPTVVAARLEIVGSGRSRALCLPLDPDATVVTRASVSTFGTIDVTVDRRSDVSNRPIVVTALARRGERWTPVARALASGSARSISLPLPDPRHETIWVRARPVVDGGQEVRGGSTLVWSAALAVLDTSARLEANESGAAFASQSTDATLAFVAIDPENGASLAASLARAAGPVGAAIARGHGSAFVEATLASHVPTDATVAAALRSGAVEPLPLPDGAVALGLLRDPWRTRARFVRGRLGSLMRAVESYADAHVATNLEDVAVVEGGHHRFNHEVLEAALEASGLGDERAAALDGEPLDIDALTTLDPAFTFDHVAQRITRARLFRLLGFLRDLVREYELDLPWARRGDPRVYTLSLLSADIGWNDERAPEREDLFDGWGQPFALVPIRGAPRFSFLQPVSGYELASPGPDGRLGTSDDVVSPFVRVLPSGSVYAEAVGEDELVARLTSVELGRATLETIAQAFEIEAPEIPSETEASIASTWDAAPTPVDAHRTAPSPVPLLASVLGGIADERATWTLPRERRPYVAFGIAFSSEGSTWRDAHFEAGAPVAARFDPPTVLRVGEELRVPVDVVRLAEGTTPTVRVTSSSASVRARIEGSAVVLEAVDEGLTDLTLSLESDGAPTWTAVHRTRAIPDGALFAIHEARFGREATVSLALPSGARAWRGRVIVGAPTALRQDPLFAEDTTHRAIDGWADVLAGAEPDPEDVAALQRAIVDSRASALEAACALAALAARSDLANRLEHRAARGFTTRLPTDLGARAALLAALAPAAGVPFQDTSATDVVTRTITELREDGWRALATERDRPSVMARLAAALLLADRSDAFGRALYERARERASEAEGFAPDVADAFVGTLALALAARQIGDDAFADGLAPGLVQRVHLAPRLGTEAVFWAYAASAYGALGASSPSHVTVEIDGRRTEMTLVDGVATIAAAPGSTVHVVADDLVWARAESRVLRETTTSDDVPVAVRLDGTSGRAGERAAIELTVESTTDAEQSGLTVEIALPSSAAFDVETRRAVLEAPAVLAIDGPDGAGVVRVHLTPLRGRGAHRVPLPVRWRASGRVRGLAAVVYSVESPWARTSRPAITLDVEAP